MAGIWSTLKSNWLLAEVAACDASKAPTESQLRNLANHSVQSDQNVTALCTAMLEELKNWQHDPTNAFKLLQVIDYCMHEGSCEMIEWFQPHVEVFENLGAKEPSEASRLRLYSREIAALLRNEATLQAERVNPNSWKPRISRTITSSWQPTGSVKYEEHSFPEPPPPYEHSKAGKSSIGVTEKSIGDESKND